MPSPMATGLALRRLARTHTASPVTAPSPCSSRSLRARACPCWSCPRPMRGRALRLACGHARGLLPVRAHRGRVPVGRRRPRTAPPHQDYARPRPCSPRRRRSCAPELCSAPEHHLHRRSSRTPPSVVAAAAWGPRRAAPARWSPLRLRPRPRRPSSGSPARPNRSGWCPTPGTRKAPLGQ